MSNPWIGVDLDGTLALWAGPETVGEPIQPMMDRVKEWIQHGIDVRIFTARACDPSRVQVVREWLDKHGLGELQITNQKDFDMIQLWDDKAVQVIKDTGEPVCPESVMPVIRRRRFVRRFPNQFKNHARP